MATKLSPIYDEEIHLEEYIETFVETFLHQWQLIVVCALGLGILGFAYSQYKNHYSPTYTATALIASAQTTTSADFGSSITSTSDVQLAQSAGSVFYDRALRLQSYVSEAQNGAIADKVIEEIGPKLNSEYGETITASELVNMVSAELIKDTDTIQLSVVNSNPVIAAEIANAWGKAYVQWINELYSDSSSGPSFLTTESDITQAKNEYEKAQVALNNFVVIDKTTEYSRQIDELTAINTKLSAGRTAVGDQQVQDHLSRLNQAYSDSRQIGLFLDNAVSLRAAVSGGGESAAISNALALTMLKTQIYAAYPGTNTLQVQNLPEAMGSNISTINAAGMVADMDALISTLDTRLTDLNKLINTLSSTVQNENYLMNYSTADSPIEIKIQENEQKIRDLTSLVYGQSSMREELTLTRDLTWKSYSALATKATEMSASVQSVQIVFASYATPPEGTTTSTPRSTLMATGVGLLFSIIVAYGYELWQKYKRRQPEAILKKIFKFVVNLFHKRPIKAPQL